MIVPTNYTVKSTILQEAINQLPQIDFKLSLNQPSGNFFYDSWKIKPEYENTIWQEILDTLPFDKGEARLIELAPGTCYHAHADIDDRWHLNITGKESYLIDLDDNEMHKTMCDGVWYSMNAGKLHSAVNFGNINRIQLVVRKLLQNNSVDDAINVELTLKEQRPDFRYVFDNTLSGWLNSANKKSILSNFKYKDTTVQFTLNKQYFDELQSRLDNMFEVKIS